MFLCRRWAASCALHMLNPIPPVGQSEHLPRGVKGGASRRLPERRLRGRLEVSLREALGHVGRGAASTVISGLPRNIYVLIATFVESA